MPHQLNQKKNIAILGYGREGKSTYTFLTQNKKILPTHITILDNNKNIITPTGSAHQLGNKCLLGLEAYDLIIRSSGVSPLQPALIDYTKKGGTLTSHMALFFSEYTGKVIGITGTKGKTTISQITYNVLKRAKIDVALIGNIGKPSLTSIDWAQPPAYIVCELSSYMLEDANPSCEIAIISNLYHEHHATRHGGLKEYHQAKRNITHGATWTLIGSQIKNINQTIAKHERFGHYGRYHIKDMALYDHNQKIIETTEIKLLGDHNYYNMCAVLGVCGILQIDIQHFVDELKSFGGVEHRLEYVGLYNNIHRYNDAIASTPESTIAALKTLPGTQTLFLGGKDGGYSFEKLIQSIDEANIANIVLYPETGAALLPLLTNKYNCYLAKDFEEGIDRANNHTTTNQIALLSCGAAYTLGIPFEEKGTRFKQHIKTLEEKG